MNGLVGLFGYMWVAEAIEHNSRESGLLDDEDWDDLYQDSIKYRLQKIKE